MMSEKEKRFRSSTPTVDRNINVMLVISIIAFIILTIGILMTGGIE